MLRRSLGESFCRSFSALDRAPELPIFWDVFDRFMVVGLADADSFNRLECSREPICELVHRNCFTPTEPAASRT